MGQSPLCGGSQCPNDGPMRAAGAPGPRGLAQTRQPQASSALGGSAKPNAGAGHGQPAARHFQSGFILVYSALRSTDFILTHGRRQACYFGWESSKIYRLPFGKTAEILAKFSVLSLGSDTPAPAGQLPNPQTGFISSAPITLVF